MKPLSSLDEVDTDAAATLRRQPSLGMNDCTNGRQVGRRRLQQLNYLKRKMGCNRSSMNSTRRYRRININPKRHNYFILGTILLIMYISSSSPSSNQNLYCYAEDGDGLDEDDYDDYYTPYPTPPPTTPKPTPSPTEYPTYNPTAEPTRAGDDFYEVDIDDYTAETQKLDIYISSISDIMLCLLCTFFWVLWLVGTIFPTKIQHLYKSEGVVVVGDVVESYITFGGGPPTTKNSNDIGEESGSEIHGEGEGGEGVEGGGVDTFDELNDLPTYHAIVSYVVPGPIATGRRKKRVFGPTVKTKGQQSPSNNYYLQQDMEKVRMAQKTIISNPDHAMEELTNNLSKDHIKASMQGTPPRPPKTGLRHSKKPSARSNSPPVVDGMRNRKLSKISENRVKENSKMALFDLCTKSFDTQINKKAKREESQTIAFYKYNRNDASDYTFNNTDEWEEEYENPEMIGNPFQVFGFPSFIMNEKPKEKMPLPVRVKKRFETNELLTQGPNNVDIIVLPGNPGSGILKTEFELEEDYMLNGTISTDFDVESADIAQTDVHSEQIGDITAAVIGLIFISVSVIASVHEALSLPYRTRSSE